MLPEQQQRILGYFIEEATDHLNTIEQGLLNLQSTLNDPDLINEVFRAAHSIKGGAAMLGLSSIQRTSHRLEDCFKVLKDNPVKIDQKLESLFLGVSDTLKALLEHLSGPFGLTEEAADTLMAEAEPVFGWLNEHLDKLVKKSPGESATSLAAGKKPVQAKMQKAASVDKNNSQLQVEVLNKLRQILQLFKQPATPENRQSIVECTDYLAELGDNRNLPCWSHLCRSATSAIANLENTYLTLAKIVITEIKQALELVLANRESEIVISEQLYCLLPVAEIELLEIGDLEDNLEESEPDTELLLEPEANYQEAAAAEALFLTDVDDINNKADNVEAENNIAALFELSDQIDDNVDRDGATVIHDLDIHGPEVGISELNTLADLFEGESPELDQSWQQEEILDLKASKPEKNDVEANIEKSKTTDSDFEDFLLFEEESNENDQTVVKEEMTIMQLFGEDFSESDLENLKDTASNKFNNSQEDSDEEEINDLLELGVDEDNNSGEVELDSLFGETDKENDQSNNYIGGFEDLNQTGSFELLFGESTEDKEEENALQDKLDLPSFEDVGLDTLFGEFENPQPDDNESDLFNDSSDTPVEDSDNIWEKTKIIPHEDVAKALEENLIEVTNSEDIFAENNSADNLPELTTEDSQQASQEDDLFATSDEADNLPELTTEDSQQASQKDDLFATSDEADNLPELTTEDSQQASQEDDLFATSDEADNLPELTTQDSQQASQEDDLFATSDEADNLPELTTQDSQQASQEDDLFATSDEADNLPELTTEDSQQASQKDDLFATSDEADNLPELTTEDSQQASQEDDLFATFDEADNLPEFITEDSQQAEEDDLFATSDEADNLPELTTQDSQQASQEDDLFATSDEADNLPELTTEDSQQAFQEDDLFATSDEADNLPELITEDAELEISDNPFAEESLNIDSTDSSQPLQFESETEQESANVNNLQEDLEDITSNSQAQLIDDLFAQDIPLDEEISLQATSKEEEITFLPFVSQAKQQVSEKNIAAPENELQQESEEILDDFSQLESLLGEQLPAQADDEFAALEDLLIPDSPQEAASDTPATENAEAEPRIDDEFGDLEKLLEQANTSIPRKNTSKATSPKTTRSAKGEQLMRVPVKHLDNLSNLVGELVVNRNTLEQDQERMRQSLDNLLHQVQNLSDVGARMQELYERFLIRSIFVSQS